MSVIVAACVKNEIDIIEAFVRHHVALVDRLLILDNGSTDGTLGVLRALEAEGLPLDIREDPSTGKYHARRATKLMREAATNLQADWIVMIDADEFLTVPPGRSLIPADADASKVVKVEWRTYVPHETDDPAETNPVRRLRYRRTNEGTQWYKVIVPRELALRPDAHLCSGCHDLYMGDKIWESRPVVERVALAHLPIRSAGQFQAKITLNGIQYRTMADRKTDWGWHYRQSYEQLKRAPRGFAAGYLEAARQFEVVVGHPAVEAFVADPLDYRGGPLRHTPAVDDDTRAWQTLLNFTEGLAERYAVLSASLDEDGETLLTAQTELVTSLHERLSGQFMQILELYDQLGKQFKEGADQRQQNAQLAEQLQERQRELDQCRQQSAANLQREREELERVRQQLAQAGEERRGLAQLLHQQQRDLGLSRQFWESELLRERQESAGACAHLEAVRRSWTWKTGRLLVGPASWFRSVAKAIVHAARSQQAAPVPG